MEREREREEAAKTFQFRVRINRLAICKSFQVQLQMRLLNYGRDFHFFDFILWKVNENIDRKNYLKI